MIKTAFVIEFKWFQTCFFCHRKYFLNKVCDINATGECGKQQDRENMEERERKGNGRGQNGGVIEAAERERTDDCTE